jgi:hypothetical protein
VVTPQRAIRCGVATPVVATVGAVVATHPTVVVTVGAVVATHPTVVVTVGAVVATHPTVVSTDGAVVTTVGGVATRTPVVAIGLSHDVPAQAEREPLSDAKTMTFDS